MDGWARGGDVRAGFRATYAHPMRDMEAKLQRRIQRYGWDLAADDYEHLWHAQLHAAQTKLLACAALAPGERVLDVACGTGLVALDAARAVGRAGNVLGIDISDHMIDAARRRAAAQGLA